MVVQNPQLHNAAIAAYYVVEGERTAAAVAAERSRLLGMAYAAIGQEPCYIPDDPSDALHRLGPCHRVYHDSLFCCAVELANDVPLGVSFDDTHIMLQLLQEEPPAELLEPQRVRQQDQAARVRASPDRVRATAKLHDPCPAR